MVDFLRRFNTFQNPLDRYRTRGILAPDEPTEIEGHQRFVRNPFEPPAPRNPFQRLPQSRPSEAGQYWDEMERLQGQVGPGVQAYRDYLERLPQREDYKPNWLTRIAAGLSGLSAGMRDPGAGIKTAMDINQAGYRSALSDYANEGVGRKEIAELEQDELEAKIKALQSARAMGLKYDEYELRRLQAENKMDVDSQNAESNRIRAESYAEKNQRPGYNSFPQADGSVLYVNQNDPEERHVVPANTVQAGQLRVAQGQLGVSRQNAATNVRRTNIYESDVKNRAQAAQREAEMRESGTYFSPSTNRPPTPRVQQDAQDVALRDMLTDPDFADFIEEDDQGYPTIVEDDGSEEYQLFRQALQAKVTEILRGGPVGGGRGRGSGR